MGGQFSALKVIKFIILKHKRVLFYSALEKDSSWD